MSLLKPHEKLEVLRMLAKAGGSGEEVREYRNGVEISRKMDGAEMKIVKSHMGKSLTSANETTLALAILQARRGKSARENEEFPELNVTVAHKDQVTLSPRFEGIDLDDFIDLLANDPRKHSPHFQLAIWCGVLRSLRALHRRGFLHCDVRRDNYCVWVEVRNIGGRFEITPDLSRIQAVDFGCALVPPSGRSAQAPDFPFIAETAFYLSPQYCAARQRRNEPLEVARALTRLTPASDLWSVGYQIQKMLIDVPPDPDVEKAFGVHASAALELLMSLPARLGYPDGLPPEATPGVAEKDGALLVNVDTHDGIIEDIEKFTIQWKCGSVIVSQWPNTQNDEGETGLMPPVQTPTQKRSLSAVATLTAVAITVVGVTGWKMWPPPPTAPDIPPVTLAASPSRMPPPTMADCKSPLRELDAVLTLGQPPNAALQEKLRTSLSACRVLLDRADSLGDDMRVAFISAAYYSLHLGQTKEAEQYANQLLQRYPDEYPGHFLVAKVRASEGDAAATLEALARAAERGLPRVNFEDERSQFAFLQGSPALAKLERKLAR